MFSVGRDGALQLMEEEMTRYKWPEAAFPRVMETRGFPENRSDGVQVDLLLAASF